MDRVPGTTGVAVRPGRAAADRARAPGASRGRRSIDREMTGGAAHSTDRGSMGLARRRIGRAGIRHGRRSIGHGGTDPGRRTNARDPRAGDHPPAHRPGADVAALPTIVDSSLGATAHHRWVLAGVASARTNRARTDRMPDHPRSGRGKSHAGRRSAVRGRVRRIGPSSPVGRRPPGAQAPIARPRPVVAELARVPARTDRPDAGAPPDPGMAPVALEGRNAPRTPLRPCRHPTSSVPTKS